MKMKKWKVLSAIVVFGPMLVGAFMPGDTKPMLEHGSDIEYTTLSSQALDGYTKPEAKRLPNGDLQFDYCVRVNHLGEHGLNGAPKTTSGIERRSAIVKKEALIDFETALRRCSVCPKQYTWHANAPSGPGDPVPEGKMEWNDALVRFPDEECFLWWWAFYWFVPPAQEGQRPSMAYIETESYETPARAYLYRSIALPFTLFRDGITWPIYYILLSFRLAEPL
jgi:hypothetical protein